MLALHSSPLLPGSNHTAVCAIVLHGRLLLVANQAIGCNNLDIAMRVHGGRHGWGVQPKALAALEQHVQVVMVVVVQPAT